MTDELIERVKKALQSDKMSSQGWSSPQCSFNDMIRDYPNPDLSKMYIPLVIEGTEEGLIFEGQTFPGLGNLYYISIPYSKLPDLVDDERVLRIEASPDKRYVSY